MGSRARHSPAWAYFPSPEDTCQEAGAGMLCYLGKPSFFDQLFCLSVPRCPGAGADGQVRPMETFSKTSYSCYCPDSKLDRLSFASEGLWPCGAVSISKLWGKLMRRGGVTFSQDRLTLPPSPGSFPLSSLVSGTTTGVRIQTWPPWSSLCPRPDVRKEIFLGSRGPVQLPSTAA